MLHFSIVALIVPFNLGNARFNPKSREFLFYIFKNVWKIQLFMYFFNNTDYPDISGYIRIWVLIIRYPDMRQNRIIAHPYSRLTRDITHA